MAKFKKKPTLIEASQWFRNGDHPQDESVLLDSPDGPQRLSEGKVVHYFKSLHIPGDRACATCGNAMKMHGELLKLDGTDEIVCPGDYIITNSAGGYYKLSARQFESMYELAEEN